jgi:D-amino-acid dehydrogenase
MKVMVLGAGVVGLTTAYWLATDGHAVEVIERNGAVARETSFANGAQLAYSYVAPLAGPGVLAKVPQWLLRRDSPLRFRPAVDPHQWRWLLQFVLACNQAASDLATRRQLVLSFYSRALMHEFIACEAFDFGHAKNGKLVMFSDVAGFDAARRLADYQRQFGCEQDALDRNACIRLEPALGDESSDLHRRMVGGIFTPSEEVGDCYRFCSGLEARLRAMGVTFRFDTPVERLVGNGQHVSAIRTRHGDLGADAYVVALGCESSFLTKPLGIHLPIYPLKGYSLTLSAGTGAPQVNVTDFKRKVVYAPLNDGDARVVRVAGMADIVGYSQAPDQERLGQLFDEALRAFPAATDYSPGPGTMRPWAGLRPTTPSSLPLMGATPYANLFLNCGHGALGWTLAMGSARVVADLVGGRPAAIPLDGFTLGA